MAKILSFSKKLLANPLAKSSIIVFIGSLFANFFNYLFHLLTGRLLGPEKYAVIAALISLFYVISFPLSIINTLVTRKVAALSAKNDLASIKGVFKLLLQNIFYLALLITFGFFLFQSPIAKFLRIENAFLVFLLGLSFVFSLLTIVGMAILQGLLKFISFSFINVFVAFLRDFFAVLAIILGFGVFGVMSGMALAGFIYFLSSIYFLKFLFKEKEVKKEFHFQTYLSFVWVVTALFGMSLMINSDVMLVKHYFPSLEAGLYASLATMGKVVFFASSSVGTVLLPLATKKNAAGFSAKKELMIALTLVFLMSICLVIGYFAFPKLVISLFYGERYFRIAPYLGLMAIYFLFYNLSYLLVQFFISLQKKRILLVPVFFALLQISLIRIFHQNFYEVLYVLILTGALLFFTFSLYCLRHAKWRF